jgi:arylsulfatase A
MNINRRQFLCSALASSGLLATLPLGRIFANVSNAQPKGDQHPNIIFILGDDVGIDCLSCYGGDRHKTPHIDALARQGIRFDRCYATPLCGPTRCQLMTGRYPFRTGALDNQETHTVQSAQEPSVARLLKAAGYATAQVGKWRQMGETPHDWGFDEYLTDTRAVGLYRTRDYIRNGTTVALPKAVYEPDLMHEFAADFIRRQRHQPFFLYYPMHLVHEPLEPTPGAADPRLDLFASNIAYMDKLVGRLMDILDETGTRENTLVIFAGDNGTNTRKTGTVNGKEIIGSKGAMSEGGAHVPLVACWPAGTPSGRTNSDLVDFSDFLPTFAAMSGASLPAHVQLDGQSFFPQLRGAAGQPREWVFVQLDFKWYVRDKQWKLNQDNELFDVSGTPFIETAVPSDAAMTGAAEARQRLQAALAKLNPAGGKRSPYSKKTGTEKELRREFRLLGIE